jgi:hypothetical protein
VFVIDRHGRIAHVECVADQTHEPDYGAALAAALGVPPPRIPPAWTARLMGPLGETLARSVRMSNQKLKTACAWRPRYPSVREEWPAMLVEMGRGKTWAHQSAGG